LLNDEWFITSSATAPGPVVAEIFRANSCSTPLQSDASAVENMKNRIAARRIRERLELPEEGQDISAMGEL
jgi:hypothetical protein